MLSCVETSVEGSREGRPGRQSHLKGQVTGLVWKRVNRRVVSEEVHIVQELCDSRGGRPGLSVLTSLMVSVDVKNY